MHDMTYLFAITPEEAAHRAHYANLSARLTDETITSVSNWCAQTPITSNSDAPGSVSKLIHRFGEHVVAQALVEGTPEELAPAARAGLLLTHAIGDNPRAQFEGASDQLLALVLEAAAQLNTAFDAITPTDPADVVYQLMAQTEPSQTLGRSVVLVERWGVPLLAPIWDDTRAANRPKPFAAFQWWESTFPWDQVGPVTSDEPEPDALDDDARARRLATEFARTGETAFGIAAVQHATSCGYHDPAWMSRWVAHHHAGPEGVAEFDAALQAAGLPVGPASTSPHEQPRDGIIVTDPWAGPFFDRALIPSD